MRAASRILFTMGPLWVGMGLMAYSLGLLIFWFVLFAPVGLALHWLVLGVSARVQAATVAPVTGIATAIIIFGSLRQAGVSVGSDGIATLVVVATVLTLVAQWRRGTAWRSRALLGAASLLVLAIIVIGSATFTDADWRRPAGLWHQRRCSRVGCHDGSGPPGTERMRRRSWQRAKQTSGKRFTGFEQFAGFTIAAGSSNGLRVAQASIIDLTTWTGYTLYSLIAGILAALTILPLFVLARWRGIRLFGLLALLALGVTSPLLFINASLGNGALVASVPFVVTGIAALLLARRDRGWYAIGRHQPRRVGGHGRSGPAHCGCMRRACLGRGRAPRARAPVTR